MNRKLTFTNKAVIRDRSFDISPKVILRVFVYKFVRMCSNTTYCCI